MDDDDAPYVPNWTFAPCSNCGALRHIVVAKAPWPAWCVDCERSPEVQFAWMQERVREAEAVIKRKQRGVVREDR